MRLEQGDSKPTSVSESLSQLRAMMLGVPLTETAQAWMSLNKNHHAYESIINMTG